jgi:TatD DNase family protein
MERAAAAGVEGIAVCGTSPADWVYCIDAHRNVQGLENYPMVFPMIGIHPWFCSEHWKESFQRLEKMVREIPMLGIGECGLDFQERFQNRAEQEACFRAHLELADELNRPVAVHCVQAWGRMLEILREFPEPKKILHAFGGAVELIPELTELNCYFSFCGNVTHPNAKRVHAAAAAVPSERLLIETDSPDFPPAGCESPNEPANLIHVARAVAALRGVSADAIASLTLSNAKSIFL